MMRKMMLLAVLSLGVSSLFAATWPYSGSARQVVSLIVCSNNKSPRLLAEVIQAESKQPYLLLPAPQSNDTRIFFVPSKGVARQISHARLKAFIQFLDPSRIVVLGGPEFVSENWLAQFGTTIPLFVARGSDWGRIAEELSYLLNISGLGKDYKRLREQLLSDSQIYRPVSKPAERVAPAAEAAVEMPAMPEGKGTEEASPAEVPATEAAAPMETSVPAALPVETPAN